MGGINSSDAGQVNSWSNSEVGGVWTTIEKVRFFAGDVAKDNYLLPVDASKILAFFLNSWTSWADHAPRNAESPNWTFWIPGTTSLNPTAGGLYPTITIPTTGTTITQNFYGLVTGDFNRSFTPASKAAAENLRLDYGQTVKTDDDGVVDLPVFVESDMTIGAVSLIMNFPADKLEILGATICSNAKEPLLYNIIGDELRIGWNSTAPFSLKAGDKLLTLKVRLIGALAKDETVRFSLAGDPLNEIADASYLAINGAAISMDVVGGSSLGIPVAGTSGNLRLANYPNPFTGTTTLAYTLPVEGEVTLEVRNMLGSVVQTLVSGEEQHAGDHKFVMDATTLAPGVYMATLKVDNSGQSMTKTIKIIRNQ